MLVGWLAGLAPEASALPTAASAATAVILRIFPSPAALDDALGNALRRAAATAVLQLPERAQGATGRARAMAAVDPIEAQRQIVADREGFAALLARDDAAVVAVARRLDELPATRGVGSWIAPVVLELFALQARDVFPREDMGGLRLAAEVLDGLRATVDVHRRSGVEAELAALHARSGDAAGLAQVAGPGDGQATLVEADRLASRGDLAGAREALVVARRRFEAVLDLAGVAAVTRREAALLEPGERIAPLTAAIEAARRAGDLGGEIEGLEELSRAHAESGEIRRAVAVLGDVAARMRRRADAAGEARALQLAGRLLCEAPPGQQDAGRGLVMLLWAGDLAASVDPVVADLVRRYVTGFQYTLSDAEFAAIEPLLDRDRDEVVQETFARCRG